MNSKFKQIISLIIVSFFFCTSSFAQYKTYELSQKGDTTNAVDKKGLKQGKWVIHVDELRGEPGYEEEGIFKNGKKDGVWRRYTLTGDIIGIESYRFGGKDGKQQYFTMMGDLVREESWHAYNPDVPYDTIPIYGTGSNEILKYKIVKTEQYSVKHGTWKFYESASGRLIKSETYDRGFLQQDPIANDVAVSDTIPKKKIKPAEVLEFEKKNSGKKKVKLREGQTGL